jgi:hypothetical protein
MTCQGCDQTLPANKRKWCSDKCRKRTLYGITCRDCGHRSNGSGGLRESPECARCSAWTREAAIFACDEFFAKHSYSPVLGSKSGKHGPINKDPGTPVPQEATARRLFGSWNEMLLAAGLPLNIDRRSETATEIDRLYSDEGWSLAQIAEHYGWTVSNVRQRLMRSGAHVPSPDGESWQRAKTHCPQGHEYAGENLYTHNRKRYCKTCIRESGRRRSRARSDAGAAA